MGYEALMQELLHRIQRVLITRRNARTASEELQETDATVSSTPAGAQTLPGQRAAQVATTLETVLGLLRSIVNSEEERALQDLLTAVTSAIENYQDTTSVTENLNDPTRITLYLLNLETDVAFRLPSVDRQATYDHVIELIKKNANPSPSNTISLYVCRRETRNESPHRLVWYKRAGHIAIFKDLGHRCGLYHVDFVLRDSDFVLGGFVKESHERGAVIMFPQHEETVRDAINNQHWDVRFIVKECLMHGTGSDVSSDKLRQPDFTPGQFGFHVIFQRL